MSCGILSIFGVFNGDDEEINTTATVAASETTSVSQSQNDKQKDKVVKCKEEKNRPSTPVTVKSGESNTSNSRDCNNSGDDKSSHSGEVIEFYTLHLGDGQGEGIGRKDSDISGGCMSLLTDGTAKFYCCRGADEFCDDDDDRILYLESIHTTDDTTRLVSEINDSTRCSKCHAPEKNDDDSLLLSSSSEEESGELLE